MPHDQVSIAEVALSEEEISAAVDVLQSGYLVQGEQVALFEEEFARRVGVEHAVAVSSGTAALHIAYLSLLEPGADVLVPVMSHVSTASMVVFADCNPVFCDVDPNTFTLDVAAATDRITSETEAIVPVHLFGNACDINGIMKLANEHDLAVIGDAAQAHGTSYDGQDVGALGDAVCYSFYPTKNMTTIEGGMITTNDPDIAETARRLRAHWQTEKYYHPDVGLNYRMTDVEAAIGRGQLDRLDESNHARRRNATYLSRHLSDIEGVTSPAVPNPVHHTFHQYTVLLDLHHLDCSRDEFQTALADRGVDTAVHYPRPIHEQPAFDVDIELPVSEDVCRRVLSLPVHPGVDAEDRETIVQAVEDTIAQFTA